MTLSNLILLQPKKVTLSYYYNSFSITYNFPFFQHSVLVILEKALFSTSDPRTRRGSGGQKILILCVHFPEKKMLFYRILVWLFKQKKLKFLLYFCLFLYLFLDHIFLHFTFLHFTVTFALCSLSYLCHTHFFIRSRFLRNSV